MKKISHIVFILLLSPYFGTGQNENTNTQPATTNINQNGYPQITSDLRIIFRVNAPDAQKVQIDLGKMYNMIQDEQGIWTVTTEPLV